MRRALELASRGLGSVSPNPMVGCVIVKDGKIIGEGWHRKYGEPHAEVNAIESAGEDKLDGATLYVTLEPCSYHGNTPPCAKLISGLPFERVVYAHIDPNPRVSGKGAQQIKEHGIKVDSGILEKEARELNKRFLAYHEKGRPYIILKWAQTADGYIARTNHDSKWISNEHSRKLVHKWRSEEDAIMVGKNTVVYDNPQLTVRDWVGKHPLRIVIDPNGKLDFDKKLFSDDHETLVYHATDKTFLSTKEHIQLPDKGEFMDNVFFDLKKRQIQSVIVEGGAFLLNELIKSDLWDEARIFISGKKFGDGIAAPTLKGEPEREETVNDDRLLYYVNSNNG